MDLWPENCENQLLIQHIKKSIKEREEMSWKNFIKCKWTEHITGIFAILLALNRAQDSMTGIFPVFLGAVINLKLEIP